MAESSAPAPHGDRGSPPAATTPPFGRASSESPTARIGDVASNRPRTRRHQTPVTAVELEHHACHIAALRDGVAVARCVEGEVVRTPEVRAHGPPPPPPAPSTGAAGRARGGVASACWPSTATRLGSLLGSVLERANTQHRPIQCDEALHARRAAPGGTCHAPCSPVQRPAVRDAACPRAPRQAGGHSRSFRVGACASGRTVPASGCVLACPVASPA